MLSLREFNIEVGFHRLTGEVDVFAHRSTYGKQEGGGGGGGGGG